MKSRILSMILALVLLCTLLPVSAVPASAETTSGSCGDSLTWSMDPSTGVLTIRGSGAMKDYTWHETPWDDYCESIKSIELPEGLTVIGEYAFASCSALKTVKLPSTVTKIGKWSFCYCNKLKTVTIPDGVTEIGGWAFCYCRSLRSVNIPDSVRSIGTLCFSSCASLKSVKLPDSVTFVGSEAFFNCTALESVRLSAAMTKIEAQTFAYCRKLQRVAIPDRVTAIGKGAFFGCAAMTSVVIPNSVTSIATEAFCGCTGMSRVTIPGSVTSIGDYAFGYQFDEKYEKLNPFSVYGKKNTAAQTYAKDNGFLFNQPELNAFSDVPANAYYKKSVDWAVICGVTKGTTETTFSPNDTCTRAQVVTFLWRAKGSPEPMGTACPYSDVKSGAYYYKAALWAAENGVVLDASGTSFGPDEACTRAQAVKLLWLSEGKPEPSGNKCPFTDVAGGEDAKPVLWAVERGITNGTAADRFSPDETCTRGQIMTFLYRAFS